MNDTKKITESKTIQSSVVAGIIGVLALLRAFGLDLDLDEGYITEVVGAFGIIITAGISIWGRIMATHKIDLNG